MGRSERALRIAIRYDLMPEQRLSLEKRGILDSGEGLVYQHAAYRRADRTVLVGCLFNG